MCPTHTWPSKGTGNLGPTQVIADTFSVSGGGTLSVGYNQDLAAQFIAVGLVEQGAGRGLVSRVQVVGAVPRLGCVVVASSHARSRRAGRCA